MKNATPSDNRKRIAIRKIDSLETEKIAQKYRKTAGISGHEFEFLIDKNDWTYLPLRKEIVEEILNKEPKKGKAFINFRKALVKRYPEYKYLIERDDWEFPIKEIFLFGNTQYDTEIPFSNVSWFVKDDKEKSLYIKINPGADKQQIIDFLNKSENNIDIKFKKLGVIVPKVKARVKKYDTYNLDLWVRVLDNFKSEEIREAFKEKFPEIYKNKFAPNGKNVYFPRIKYYLIAEYVFHRFNIKKPSGRVFSQEYIKTIAEKSKKNKTQIKKGLFTKIP